MAKLPIEPLDEGRWNRIERELEHRLARDPIQAPASADERPARWAPVVAIGAVAAAAIVLMGWEASQSSKAHPVATATVTHVETEDAPSHVNVGSSSLDVAAHSAAQIEGSDETGVVVTLDRGAVECEVAPRRGNPPFIVHAGDVSVRVIGTHFRVERDDATTRVSVQRGVVQVDSQGTIAVVRAGSTWPPTTANETTSTAVPPPPAPTLTGVRTAPAVVAPTASTSTSTQSPRERYDHALALEASRPDEALAIYQGLASGDGPWAMNALYAEGRFELERGNKDVARDRFAEYLRRFPNGPNAGDARDLSAKLK